MRSVLILGCFLVQFLFCSVFPASLYFLFRVIPELRSCGQRFCFLPLTLILSELRLVDLLMFLQTKHPETSRNNQTLKVFLSLVEFKLLSALCRRADILSLKPSFRLFFILVTSASFKFHTHSLQRYAGSHEWAGLTYFHPMRARRAPLFSPSSPPLCGSVTWNLACFRQRKTNAAQGGDKMREGGRK